MKSFFSFDNSQPLLQYRTFHLGNVPHLDNVGGANTGLGVHCGNRIWICDYGSGNGHFRVWHPWPRCMGTHWRRRYLHQMLLTLKVGYEVPSSVKLTKPSSFGIRGKLRAETFLRNFKIYFVLNVIKPYSIAENVLNIKCHLLVYIHQTRYELNSLGPRNISFRPVRPASGVCLHLLIC